MPKNGKEPYYDQGASFSDAARDLSLGDLIAGLKERKDPALWDSFFAHMDTVLGPDTQVEQSTTLTEARRDLGNEDAADLAQSARFDQLRQRIRAQLQTMRARF